MVVLVRSRCAIIDATRNPQLLCGDRYRVFAHLGAIHRHGKPTVG